MKTINSPKELLKFMSNNITYGYLGKNGRIYSYTDNDFNQEWEDQYILESPTDLLKTLHGNCWDQVEFEREWFLNNGYEIKTFYEMVNLDYENDYPSHSFLTYKDENNNWNWFENSDFNNQGIHTFKTVEELLNYQFAKYLELLKQYNITNEEIEKIIITEFNKPKYRISSEKYIEHMLKSNKYQETKKSINK